jgi:hypothetical protein
MHFVKLGLKFTRYLRGCDCVWAAVQRVDDLIGTTESKRGP